MGCVLYGHTLKAPSGMWHQGCRPCPQATGGTVHTPHHGPPPAQRSGETSAGLWVPCVRLPAAAWMACRGPAPSSQCQVRPVWCPRHQVLL